VKRLRVVVVQRLSERGREGSPRRGTAKVGHIHHAGQGLRSDQPAKGSAHADGERDVCVLAAEHHHGEAGRGYAVRGKTQTPPDPERIDDADPRTCLHQPLDQALGRVGLAGAGRSDNGQAFVQRRHRQHADDSLAAGLLCDRNLADRTRGRQNAAHGGFADLVVARHLCSRALPRPHSVHDRRLLLAG
jgi:hypothetical protein